jgi:hypothetical protein
MSIFAMMIQDDGLTLREVIADIPHDVPAMVVYVLIALFVGFIWWGSRGGDAGPAAGGPTSSAGSTHPPEAGAQR